MRQSLRFSLPHSPDSGGCWRAWPQLLAGGAAIVIGIAFSTTGTRFCRHGCWLDALCDLLLPESLEFAASGLPWLLIGAALVAHTLLRRPARRRGAQAAGSAGIKAPRG